MVRHIISVRELGCDVCWLLVQQTLGMPDAKMQSDFMVDRVALLLFARQSLPERLCVTAAVRQMGGTTIYQGNQGEIWEAEVHNFRDHFLPVFGYYMDCLYAYWLPLDSVIEKAGSLTFPIINAGNSDAHPAHALADVACMLKVSKELRGEKAAWIGCANGTLYSIVEATAWFPFSLRIALPPHTDQSRLKEQIERLNTDVELVDLPEEAIKDASFIYAGRKSDSSPVESREWSITSKLMSYARKDAKLFLSASPMRAIEIEQGIMSGSGAMLKRQAEYRLRMHKRMLHWVFEK